MSLQSERTNIFVTEKCTAPKLSLKIKYKFLGHSVYWGLFLIPSTIILDLLLMSCSIILGLFLYFLLYYIFGSTPSDKINWPLCNNLIEIMLKFAKIFKTSAY